MSLSKKIVWLGLCLLVTLGLGYDWWRQTQPEGGGEGHTATTPVMAVNKASPVSFQTLDGRKVGSWNDFAEPIVLIHFWASWCPPCLVELPQLTAFAEKHARQVAVVIVSIDTDEAAMKKMWGNQPGRKTGWWVWDKDKALSLKTFQVMNVPETIVLDADRRMIDKIVGQGDWPNMAIERWLK